MSAFYNCALILCAQKLFCGVLKTTARSLFITVLTLCVLTSGTGYVFAGSCELKSSFDFLRFVSSSDYSYCETCGYGYVTVEIRNPYRYVSDPADPLGDHIPGAAISDILLAVDLGSSGLTFAPSAPEAVTFTYNGGLLQHGTTPWISGFNDQILTLTSAQISAFSELLAREEDASTNFITVKIAVASNDPSHAENLWTVSRNISSTVSFSNDSSCPESSFSPDPLNLILFEPVLDIIKTGWNYDSGQREATASNPVFATNNDDVVWRIAITNTGTAPAQDMRLDDIMSGSSLTHTYLCSTAESANQIANNNGSGSATGCQPVTNVLEDFDITSPFGANQEATYDHAEIDVPVGDTVTLYVVGKVGATAACTGYQTNTVTDVQWGCQSDAPVGGIASPGDVVPSLQPTAEAKLITKYNDDDHGQLTVQRSLTGVNTGQPVGARGMMTIRIQNQTGGSVKNIHFSDLLPPEYVVDTTFKPTLVVSSPYGAYPGRVSTLDWNNPDTINLLANTQPDFNLTSNGNFHSIYTDQENMLRHGDTAVVRFRVVLIDSDYYDRAADLDVNPEEFLVTVTDPVYKANLDNALDIDFETFCSGDGIQHFSLTGNGTGNPSGTSIPAHPEDLDVAVNGAIFILSNDPSMHVNIPIVVTNNGGHDAADYHLYVTFGPTIEVVAPPSECSQITLTGSPLQPNPRKIWVDPLSVHDTAIVYACTSSSVIAPRASRDFIFETRKSTDSTRIALDDLTLRADVIGEITLADGTALTIPAPIVRADGELDPANNYSLDATWARVMGFNLLKSQVGTCSENNPPTLDDGHEEVQIGEECDFNIMAGGWFGFETPGFEYISVQNINVLDEIPDGQAYLTTTDPYRESTSLIKDVSLLPSDLAAPDERQFDWTFNVPDSQRIETPDEWFEVDVKTRILNKTIDARSAPNYHAQTSANILDATFDARFKNDNTGLVEAYTLDSNTVGFPYEALRRVDLTVTDPYITLVKEVCNESLYGTGSSCRNFVTVTDEGDAYSQYIYRITVTNEMTRNDVQRAPAYDVVVTDSLDPSDYAYVIPYSADGLDNDGDGVNDSADSGGEGTIANNVPDDGTPAVLSFSYDHSSALERIDPGGSVVLYYRVDFDDDAAPLQTFINEVSATYDSLEDEFGNQTTPVGRNSELAGPRVYIADSTAASVQIVPVATQPKEVTATAVTPVSATGSVQNIKIGEELEYQITALLPVAQFRRLTIVDELPIGMRCSEAPVVNLDAEPFVSAGFEPGGTITPICLDGSVRWEFGDQRITIRSLDRYEFPVSFIAQVLNVGSTNDGTSISNGVPATTTTISYINESGENISYDVSHVDIALTEPAVEFSASFDSVDHDAADIVTVTVTATNTGTATAYNLRILDDLSVTRFSYVGNLGGSNLPDHVDLTSFGPHQPVFEFTDVGGLAVGESYTFTYEVLIDTDVEPDDVLDNELQGVWTSLPGSDSVLNSLGQIGAAGEGTGMRNGVLPHVGDSINDYESSTSFALTLSAPDLSKADITSTLVPTIGVHKQFTLQVTLPEGVIKDLRISDILNAAGISYVYENNSTYPTSYSFQDIESVNGEIPARRAFNSVPVDESRDVITWDIGNVVTATEEDTSSHAVNPQILITLYARINNDLVTDAGDFLRNGLLVTYQNGATDSDTSLDVETTSIGVTEPRLHLSKAVINVTPGKTTDAPAEAGDILEYSLTIVNVGSTGTTAYDINIVDSLPAGLVLSSSFTPMATSGGAAVPDFVSIPDGAPDGNLVWGRDNDDSSLNLATGTSLVLTYRTDVQWVSDPDGNIENSVIADWTSLGGSKYFERTGDGCPDIIAPNDYCAGPVSASTIGLAPEVIFQMTVGNETTGESPAIEATPGDVVRYTMTVQNISSTQADFYIQNVIDELNHDPRFLPGSLVIDIPAGTGVDYSDSEGGDDETGIVYVDELSVPAGDTLTFSFTARLASVIPDGTVVFSQSELYIFGFGAVLSDDPEVSGDSDPTQITISSSPEWLFTKVANDLTNSADILMPGDQLHYELSVQNIGSEDASGVTLTDVIPAYTTYVPGSTTLNDEVVADVGGESPLVGGLLIHAPVPGNTEPGVMLVEDVPNTARVTFDVIVNADVAGGTVISNQGYISGSGSGSGSFVNIGSDDPDTTTVNDATMDVVSDLEFELSVYNNSTSSSGETATPGDQLFYSLRMTNTTTVAMSNLVVMVDLDSLHSGDTHYFVPGSLQIESLPIGADSTGTDPVGGSKGSGLLQIALTLEAGDTALVRFSADLLDVISSGTEVLSQAYLSADGYPIKISDSSDSTLGEEDDPTHTAIVSSPEFIVEKVDQFLDEDTTILLPGERIQYTLTIKNVGTEDAYDVILTDYIPANTTYIAGSTTLNGANITDVSGACPLINGLTISATSSSADGEMLADASSASMDNVATVTFQVIVSDDAMIGLIVANQGRVSGAGRGSGATEVQPSDDPDTTAEEDPTQSIIGDLPLLYAVKTVEILDDYGTPNIVDPGDTLTYTITISNSGAKDATDVVLTDIVPPLTTYVSGHFTVDGNSVSDGGYLPLIDGLALQSVDVGAPGSISAGSSVSLSFIVLVDADAAEGSLITNQGTLSSTETGNLLTDSDGDSTNGYQETVIVVGAKQNLAITKTVALVDSSTAAPGSELAYTVTVTNRGSMAATDVSVSDDLSALLGNTIAFVPDSPTLNGLTTGVTYSASTITAYYSDNYGDLPVGQSFTVSFHVVILNDVALGTTITNSATVFWNSPVQQASASVSLDVGGTPGAATLNGIIWHDANFDSVLDDTESLQQDWTVDLYLNDELIRSVFTDENGVYQCPGLLPTAYAGGLYDIKFSAPGAGMRTASLGLAVSDFSDTRQHISQISAGSGSNLQNLNMPLTPNGVIYNSIARTPISGATVTLVNPDTGQILPSDCFEDAAQYNQLTTVNGYYKFDLAFGASCPANRNYLVNVAAPLSGYIAGESLVIPPQSSEDTTAFDVTTCPANVSQDAIPSTSEHCEVVVHPEAPDLSAGAGTSATQYHLNFILGGTLNPGHRQIFNNQIPIDPVLSGAVAISKVASLKNVTRGSLVPYTITVTNIYGVELNALRIIDQFPAGFKYVSGSAQIGGVATEPERSGRLLTWDDIDLSVDETLVLRLLLVVGSGVGEGEYVNRARVQNTILDTVVSGEATATVKVIPDPDFDCSDVIGKVFYDRNLNGVQDAGEYGLSGVRIATAQGLVITTDAEGRYHLTCAAVPDQDRGSNFIMKLDDRSLPTGYRVTSENPRVQRLTGGKTGKFNFSATLHRVVQIDLSDEAFEAGSTRLRVQWQSRISELLNVLSESPAVLRLAYLGDVDDESLVSKRLDQFKAQVEDGWAKRPDKYYLMIETEIFWRRGTPP